jgi:hypothetical protein
MPPASVSARPDRRRYLLRAPHTPSPLDGKPNRFPKNSELRLVATLRRAARERNGPLPSIDVADALQDERRELAAHRPTKPPRTT